MMIRPVDYNGMIQNQQGVHAIKHREDAQSTLVNQTISHQVVKETEHQLKQVNKKEDADRREEKHDAKEKGKNQYFAQGRKGQGDTGKSDGYVKKKGETGGFDISV